MSNNNHDTVDKAANILGPHETRVLVSGCDIDGIARGKQISRNKFLKSIDEGFGMCNVVFGWDLHDLTYVIKPPLQSQDSGFGDMIARIDLKTKRIVPWDGNMSYFLLDFHDPISGEPLPCCPRGLLKKVLARYNQLNLSKFTTSHSNGDFEGNVFPLCGMEYEWFHFSETPNSLAEKRGSQLTPLTPGMFGYSLHRPQIQREYFNDLFDTCHAFRVPLEGLHTETGPGVYEVALEYTDALELADRAHLFKVATKQIALKYGITPCFMAKPYPDQPGCSGHMHFSVAAMINGLRTNLFAPQKNMKESAFVPGTSCILAHFLAGVLEGLPSIMAILAPNINSYKRLVENYWAPITVSYGFENRTAAIRLIAPPHCPPEATRIEVRVPGADVNPYLAEAAILACGLYGLENKLDLAFPPTKGDVLFEKGSSSSSNGTTETQGGAPAMTVKNGQRLPTSLRDAVRTMDAPNSLARQVLGDAFVEHYVATRLHECRLWDRAVTDWELKRYMETV